MKKAVVSVTNDLVTDQRVHKICVTLMENGYEALLAGRRKKESMPVNQRPYMIRRMRLLFERGPLFYAEFNIRLFLLLLFTRADLLYSNDLDTLAANYLVSRIKRIPVIYDSHEFFTETPELIHRKRVRKVWLTIEKLIFPKLHDVITVSPSIANAYRQRYGKEVKVMRNAPVAGGPLPKKTREQLGLPKDKKIAILQGSGINIQRGAEELVEAMQYTHGILLLVVGGGDVISLLQEMASSLHLEGKIRFIPKVPFHELRNYTACSDLGITIDKDTNLNYRYSLPNKLFDYIHAGIPVLATPLPEIKQIIEEYDIGTFLNSHDPKEIAHTLSETLNDAKRLSAWKQNTGKAAGILCWENEKQTLINIFKRHG